MAKNVSKYRLGVDLGGSKILAVVIDADGRVVARAKKRTKPEKGYDGVLERIRKVADKALEDADVSLGKEIKALGVGLPGPVLPREGIVQGAVNLGWGRKPVAKDLGDIFGGLPVAVGNDVNFGALGEVTHGAGAGTRSAYALFMGTGLGGAQVLDGKVQAGAHGFAGEIGHLPGPFDGAACTCGQTGCLETVASKSGLKRLIAAAIAAGQPCLLEDPGDLRSSQLRAAWDQNCPTVRAALTAAAHALGWGVVVAGLAVDPAVVILGGGVIEELGTELMPQIRASVARHVYYSNQVEPKLVIAELGDDAVATGAAVAGGALL